MHINPRTFNILNALRNAAFSKEPFIMPEILRQCSTASEDAVKTIARRVRKGADALPYAHFFDILYTDADVRRFITAFADSAPEEYVQEVDLDTSMPWCMPWTWENVPLTAEGADTPESLAYRLSAYYAYDIRNTFRIWKEDDCAKIVQDIWDSYRNGKEIPDKYEHQAELFRKAFDAIDEMGENTVETDEVIDQIAEEIFDSFITAIF